jgi:hypothetical protein
MKKKKGCELPKHLLLSTSIHSEILDNRQKKKEEEEEGGKGGYMFCFWRSVRVCSCGSGGYFSFLFSFNFKRIPATL